MAEIWTYDLIGCLTMVAMALFYAYKANIS